MRVELPVSKRRSNTRLGERAGAERNVDKEV